MSEEQPKDEVKTRTLVLKVTLDSHESFAKTVAHRLEQVAKHIGEGMTPTEGDTRFKGVAVSIE